MVTAGETVVMVLMLATDSEYPSALSRNGKPLLDETPSAWEKKNAEPTKTQTCQPRKICFSLGTVNGCEGYRCSAARLSCASSISRGVRNLELQRSGVLGSRMRPIKAIGMVHAKPMKMI